MITSDPWLAHFLTYSLIVSPIASVTTVGASFKLGWAL